jgi:hypothetical protein
MRTVVEAVEQVRVDPLEIEAERDRLPHARIAEAGPALVERLAVEIGAQLARKFALHHASVLERGKIVGGGPGARGKLAAPRDFALLECLEGRIAVPVEIDADSIEVIEAAPDGQVARPIVLHALILDEAARGDAPHLVGSGAWKRLQPGAVEGLALLCGLGEDREAHDAQDRALRLPAGKGQAHLVGGKRFRRHQFGEGKLEIGMALLLQELIAEGHILRRQRRAVVEAGLRPQLEGEAVAVGGEGHAFGHQSVQAVRFVPGAHHQRIEAHLHARRRVAGAHIAVERVEGEDVLVVKPVARLEVERAALGRLRAGIVEVLEIRPIFEIAEGGEAMKRHLRLDLCEGLPAEEGSGDGRSRHLQEMAPGGGGKCHGGQFWLLYLAASAASRSRSIHQDSVSTPVYSGCLSGMPNLFQKAIHTTGR